MKTYSLLLLLFLVACNQANTDFGDGKVVSIADGDTFTLLTPQNKQVKVRLFGIDCPERAQDFGTAARQKLSELVFGKNVDVEEKNKDRYGRIVAIAYTEDGMNVNEQMIKEGLAWHYKEYSRNEAWDMLEQNARRKRIGLWAKRNPTPPWLWRKEKRAATTE